ncbi:hypothetical protein PS15m_006817 [Mucor circinelloides]
MQLFCVFFLGLIFLQICITLKLVWKSKSRIFWNKFCNNVQNKENATFGIFFGSVSLFFPFFCLHVKTVDLIHLNIVLTDLTSTNDLPFKLSQTEAGTQISLKLRFWEHKI